MHVWRILGLEHLEALVPKKAANRDRVPAKLHAGHHIAKEQHAEPDDKRVLTVPAALNVSEPDFDV